MLKRNFNDKFAFSPYCAAFAAKVKDRFAVKSSYIITREGFEVS